MNTAYLFSKTNPERLQELKEYFTLGSASESNWVENSISDRQFRIEKRDNNYVLRDLRSGVPTRLNGASILEAPLKDQDEIQVEDITYIFQTETVEEANSLGLHSKNENWNEKLQQLGHVALTDHPVLLLGPSGTGKEIVAQAIHDNSKRKQGPFISVNCSALTETLVESELFGHTKGAFTGAMGDRKGAFEAARGGTLFLDEIGDLPYGLQAKLLRALEAGEIRPVGSDQIVKTNVRIIAATHQNLIEKIQNQQFRADLYFRLNVVTINTPALSSRMEDFDDILYSFARKFKVRFSFNSMQMLKKHQWPGNIRELRNVVARASALFPKQEITEEKVHSLVDLIFYSQEQKQMIESQLDSKTLPVIKEIEKQMIIKRLRANYGNQRRTAADLGMPKSTLHDRLKDYDIDPRSFTKHQSGVMT